MKNLIVLSGGGFKASYQVGVLQRLQALGIIFDCIMGTSGGALNGVLAASHRINDLEEIWNDIAKKGVSGVFESDLLDLSTMKLDFKKLIKYIIPFIGFKLLTSKGREEFKTVLKTKLNSIEYLATSNGLESILTKVVNKDEVKVPFYFNFNDLITGKEIITSKSNYIHNKDYINGIVASASIPLILKPKKVFTKNAVYSKCVDGGISSNALISEAIRYIKADNDPTNWRLIVVNCNSQNLEKITSFNGIIPIFERVVLGIMLNTLNKKEVNMVTTINNLARSSNGYLDIPFYCISPESDDLGNTMEITEDINSYRINRGIEDANKFIKII